MTIFVGLFCGGTTIGCIIYADDVHIISILTELANMALAKLTSLFKNISLSISKEKNRVISAKRDDLIAESRILNLTAVLHQAYLGAVIEIGKESRAVYAVKGR